MWWVLADSVRSTFGLKMTMSASLPGAIVPFLGKRPNILAGAVATSSTNRFREIRPEFTPPWKIRLNRSSTPGSPFGILEKSPRPISFCQVSLHQHVNRAAVLGMHHDQPTVFGGTA